MENNQPSIKSNLTHCKDEIDGFLVRNEVKEKISSFASASYEKAKEKCEEYKVKEKSVDFLSKTKECLTPYVKRAGVEAWIAGTYLFAKGKNVFNDYVNYRNDALQPTKSDASLAKQTETNGLKFQ